ncbi:MULTISPECIES: hypothetical protein [Arthrospira]|jgi:hypothetical protein|uniref:Uncharacterized protein n=1 Tax=Limnospira platensis NIES-46 TaxID=1236695 RepID=A0A5M3T7K3_LIMPL|nr:hypothetical protein [Arthrospira platensis]AMW31134.1 hypothetical protein AP285_27675 [Arthrospira platensis YZ]KDR54876.1 hypothetical protein APPUASWS_025445 [Arthrospira platensis str. Paraca]MBD2669165.1 hypothetical protein [Arthrospira platensis FACHB-439]MBD2712015.1 hypothetical protein [Arthrospira platensis FACHB-835]MDF2208550.1 hypothetical protein [Arthrospira platensis NCB002]MDT9184631.1 hypothetical protein [Limnospira sp. PMC 289.06]MDT9294606.1 hypothetical protein [Ar
MKPQHQDSSNQKQPDRPIYLQPPWVIFAPLLIGVLALVAYTLLVTTDSPTPDPIIVQNPEAVMIMDEISPNLADLPSEISTALRQDVIDRTGSSPEEIEILAAERQTWPNTCLGLAKPDELCGQMLVDGWRVRVSDGQRHWLYRTNHNGQNFRLETE